MASMVDATRKASKAETVTEFNALRQRAVLPWLGSGDIRDTRHIPSHPQSLPSFCCAVGGFDGNFFPVSVLFTLGFPPRNRHPSSVQIQSDQRVLAQT